MTTRYAATNVAEANKIKKIWEAVTCISPLQQVISNLLRFANHFGLLAPYEKLRVARAV